MTDIDRVLRSSLKLRHLHLLVTLDEFRHLGRAAESLSLTQPAVSKSSASTEPVPPAASALRIDGDSAGTLPVFLLALWVCTGG